MPPALIPAGIAAAATVGGALISSHAQSKAADQAQSAQDQATQAQLKLGQQSMDLQNRVYGSNYDTLSPFVSRGNVAGDAINALLGLPAAPAMHNPMASSAGSSASAPPAPVAAPLPSIDQLNALKHDGIPGNYRAAIGQASGGGGGLLHDIASVGGFGLAGLAATNSSPPPISPALAALRPQSGVQSAPTVSQTPLASSNLQQQAQQAIAAGADPAAVNARLAQLQTRSV
jgi:hypothetical protein